MSEKNDGRQFFDLLVQARWLRQAGSGKCSDLLLQGGQVLLEGLPDDGMIYLEVTMG